MHYFCIASLFASTKQPWPEISEIIKNLVDSGAVPDKEDLYNRTALYIAATNENPLALQTLVNAGAQLERENQSKWTALDYAILENRSENTLALIELGADWIRSNAFSAAAGHDDCRILEILMDKLTSATEEKKSDARDVIESVLSKQAAKNRSAKAEKTLKAFLLSKNESVYRRRY